MATYVARPSPFSLAIVRQLDGSANTRREVRRRVDGWSNLRPREPPGGTRKRVIAPRGGLELLGDELERTALLLDSVVPYRLLQKDERLLERTEHGLGRRQRRRRRRCGLTPRPRRDREPECAGGQRQSGDEKDGDEASRREPERRGGK